MRMWKGRTLWALTLALALIGSLAMGVLADDSTASVSTQATDSTTATVESTTSTTASSLQATDTGENHQVPKGEAWGKRAAAIKQQIKVMKTTLQKKAVAGAKVGIIEKIENQNGKTVLYLQRPDKSPRVNYFVSVKLDPARTVVYDRTTKSQKTLADLTSGDVVRIIPVRAATLMLVDKIGHRDLSTPPPTTTPDTLTVTPSAS